MYGNKIFDEEGVTSQWRKDNLISRKVRKIKWRKYREKYFFYYLQKNKMESSPNNTTYKGGCNMG